MKNSSLGFSLFELLAVMTIMMISFSCLLPAYHFFLNRSHEEVLASELMRVLSMARSEALLRGVPVTFCSSVDHIHCSSTWQADQILFVDEKQQGVVSNHEDILWISNKIISGQLHWRSFPLDQAYLQFMPSGLMAYENGSFWYCEPHEKNPAWMLVVNQAGRGRLVLSEKVDRNLKCV